MQTISFVFIYGVVILLAFGVIIGHQLKCSLKVRFIFWEKINKRFVGVIHASISLQWVPSNVLIFYWTDLSKIRARDRRRIFLSRSSREGKTSQKSREMNSDPAYPYQKCYFNSRFSLFFAKIVHINEWFTNFYFWQHHSKCKVNNTISFARVLMSRVQWVSVRIKQFDSALFFASYYFDHQRRKRIYSLIHRKATQIYLHWWSLEMTTNFLQNIFNSTRVYKFYNNFTYT